jgi:hypothetical protein
MSQIGNTMITMIFVANPENQAEGERIFASHAKWMKESHHKNGELEMLSYNVAKSAEFSNPLDPSSSPTGNTIYTVCEIYKNPEGLTDHWKQGQETWIDFGALMTWIGKVKFTIMHGSPIQYSLW